MFHVNQGWLDAEGERDEWLVDYLRRPDFNHNRKKLIKSLSRLTGRRQLDDILSPWSSCLLEWKHICHD